MSHPPASGSGLSSLGLFLQIITQGKILYYQNTMIQNMKESPARTKSGTGSWREKLQHHLPSMSSLGTQVRADKQGDRGQLCGPPPKARHVPCL